MNSTIRNAPHTLMFDSPRPVDPAAPTVLSQYCPAPMIGESPTRPGTFQEMPLVVVTELMSPFASTAFMLMVPHVWAMPYSSYSSSLPPNDASDGRCDAGAGLTGAERCCVSDGSSHESPPLRRVFHLIHSARLFAVRRSCSLKPILSAKRFASWPTRKMWSV